MSKIVSRKNIPDSGDIVDSVKYNKDRTIGAIIFDSGKIVYFNCDPVEFDRKKKFVKEGLLINPRSSKSITNSAYQNTHVDPSYQKKVLHTLANLKGVSVSEIRNELSAMHPTPAQMSSEQNQMALDMFEEKKRAILEQSEERSKRLAEQISVQNGGKLEGSFKGKDSIQM